MNTKRKITIAVAIMFMLNIAVTTNSKLDSNASLSGIVNSAFAEEENLNRPQPQPSSIQEDLDIEDPTIKEDEDILDYIINLIK